MGNLARQKFPSDENRRKTRPHVKVHLTCRSHERYGHVFEKLEDRAIVWGLWFLGVQYNAPRNGNRVTLGHGDLTWLTGRAEWAHALRALRALCARMQYPVSAQGRRVTVTIRNLQRKQGFDYALRSVATHTTHPPEAEADTEAEADNPQRSCPSPKARGPAEIPEGCFWIAGHLRNRILAAYPDTHVPDSTEASLRPWAGEIDRMLRIDGREASKVVAAIDWALGANLKREVSFVVLSAKALRTKYDRMSIAARLEQEERDGKRGKSGSTKNQSVAEGVASVLRTMEEYPRG